MKLLYICYEDLSASIAPTIHTIEVCRNLARLGHQVMLIAPAIGRYTEVLRKIDQIRGEVSMRTADKLIAVTNGLKKELCQRYRVPISKWFRGELKDYISHIILDQRSLARGYFRKEALAN